MAAQYVIRAYAFTYYDEDYQTEYGDWGDVAAVFTDAASAQTELERLTVREMRFSLGAYDPYSGINGAPDEFVERINAFCIERCGNPMFEDGAHSADSIPEGMSDADVIELAKLSYLEFYRIFEVPEDGGFVALWLPKQKHYVGKYIGTYILDIAFHPSIEDFMDEDHWPNQIFEVFPSSWQGAYEELSDTPLLLRQFVDLQPNMAYDETTQTLSFTSGNKYCPASDISVPDLFSLNALLKDPVFEIRRLTVAELQAMKA